MNKIDYKLEIIGEKKTYYPREEFINPIAKSSKKIFEITADNSYGKTFFLNLLAYALDADKFDDDKILSPIKKMISRYDNKKDYNLEYNINIDLPDNKTLKLNKGKGEAKTIQIDDSAPLNYRKLHQKLSVIYDIPTNPGERLNAIIKDLNVWNDNLINNTNDILGYLNEIYKGFNNIRDEDKIILYNNKAKEFESTILEEKTKIVDLEEAKDVLVLIKDLEDLKGEIKRKDDIEKRYASKTKKIKTLKKPVKVNKKDEDLIKGLNNECSDIERDFRIVVSELIRYINNDNDLHEFIDNDSISRKSLKYIIDANVVTMYDSDDYVELNSKFKESVKHLNEWINSFFVEKKNDKSFIINNKYNEFLELLDELAENKIDQLLKGLDIKELKNQLNEILKDHKIKNYDEFKKFLRIDYKRLESLLADYNHKKNQLQKESRKKVSDENAEEYYKVEADYKQLKLERKIYKERYTIKLANCANKLEINDLSRIDSIDKISNNFIYPLKIKIIDEELLDNVAKSINTLELNIKRKKDNIYSLDSDMRFNKRALDLENKKQESKFNDVQKSRIISLIKILNMIVVNLKKYAKVISNIEQDRFNSLTDKGDIEFISLAGRIIAYSMDNKLLRADGKYLNLNYYDMNSQEFHCDDIIIKKDDVSTGLASANYLKQRIENIDGEYVVILLDEIGNMAQSALDSVVESIKKIEDQNRLVLAVFTRPNDNDIKIIEY